MAGGVGSTLVELLAMAEPLEATALDRFGLYSETLGRAETILRVVFLLSAASPPLLPLLPSTPPSFVLAPVLLGTCRALS
eukprot:2253462-Pyramimonas_sp.AAC.1